MEWQLFADIAAEDVRRLLQIAHRRTFARGEVVFHRGDPANSLHLIVEGRFAVRIITPLGEAATLGVRGPGDEVQMAAPGRRLVKGEASPPCATRNPSAR